MESIVNRFTIVSNVQNLEPYRVPYHMLDLSDEAITRSASIAVFGLTTP